MKIESSDIRNIFQKITQVYNIDNYKDLEDELTIDDSEDIQELSIPPFLHQTLKKVMEDELERELEKDFSLKEDV